MSGFNVRSLREALPTLRVLGLLDLPVEVGIMILRLLDYRDILNCQRTCRGLSAIAQETSLQYIISLGVAGLVEGSSLSTLTTKERSDLLHSHQMSWKDPTMYIVARRSFPFRIRTSDWRIFDALFVRSYLDPHGSPGCESKNTISMFYYSFESQELIPRNLHLDYDFDYYHLDLPQDLLMLKRHSPQLQINETSFQFIFLSLHKGTPHPLAAFRTGILQVPIGPLVPRSRTRVVLSGNLLLLSCFTKLIFGELETLVVIVNWKSGAMQRIKPYSGCRIYGLCAVAERYLLVGGRKGPVPTIDVYFIGEFTDYNSPANPTLLSTFEFPLPDPKVRTGTVQSISLSTSQPSYETLMSEDGLPKHTFTTHPSNSLVSIQISYPKIDGRDRSGYHEVITLLSTFLPPSGSNHTSPMHAVFNWQSWGPLSTRWLADGIDHRAAPEWATRYLYGYRLAALDLLLDFNPVDIARELHHDQEQLQHQSPRAVASDYSRPRYGWPFERALSRPAHRSRIVVAPTVIRARDGYAEDIVSRLPYRVSFLEHRLSYNALVYGDNLLGLKSDAQGNLCRIDVLTA